MNKEEYIKSEQELLEKIAFLEKKLETGLRFENDSTEYLMNPEYYNIEFLQKKAEIINKIGDHIKASEEAIKEMKENNALKNKISLDEELILVRENITKQKIEADKELNLILDGKVTNIAELLKISKEFNELRSKENEITSKFETIEKDSVALDLLIAKTEELKASKEKEMSSKEAEYIDFEKVEQDKDQLAKYKEDLELLKQNNMESANEIEKERAEKNKVKTVSSLLEGFDTTGMTDEQIAYYEKFIRKIKNIKKFKEFKKDIKFKLFKIPGVIKAHFKNFAKKFKNIKKFKLSKVGIKFKVFKIPGVIKAYFKKVLDEIDNYEEETEKIEEPIVTPVEENKKSTFTEEQIKEAVDIATGSSEPFSNVNTQEELETAKKLEEELDSILDVEPDKENIDPVANEEPQVIKEPESIKVEGPKTTDKIVKVTKITNEHAADSFGIARANVEYYINKISSEKQSIKDAREIDGALKPKEQIVKILKLPGEKSKQFIDFVRPKVVEALLGLAIKVEGSNKKEEPKTK